MQKIPKKFSGKKGGVDVKQLASLLLIVVPIILLWGTPVVYPLRMLVVFFHELSHGVAALLTGGSLVAIQLDSREGGVCLTQGGSRFLILTAGYLGSMMWGGLILVVAARTRYDKQLTMLLGGLLLTVCVFFVRPFLGFGFLFCAAVGGALVAAGRFLPMRFNDLLLKVIGLVNCLYAVEDIVSDGISRRIADSDSEALAQLTHLPGVAWSSLWLVASVACAVFFLKVAARGEIGD